MAETVVVPYSYNTLGDQATDLHALTTLHGPQPYAVGISIDNVQARYGKGRDEAYAQAQYEYARLSNQSHYTIESARAITVGMAQATIDPSISYLR